MLCFALLLSFFEVNLWFCCLKLPCFFPCFSAPFIMSKMDGLQGNSHKGLALQKPRRCRWGSIFGPWKLPLWPPISFRLPDLGLWPRRSHNEWARGEVASLVFSAATLTWLHHFYLLLKIWFVLHGEIEIACDSQNCFRENTSYSFFSVENGSQTQKKNRPYLEEWGQRKSSHRSPAFFHPSSLQVVSNQVLPTSHVPIRLAQNTAIK